MGEKPQIWSSCVAALRRRARYCHEFRLESRDRNLICRSLPTQAIPATLERDNRKLKAQRLASIRSAGTCLRKSTMAHNRPSNCRRLSFKIEFGCRSTGAMYGNDASFGD